MNSISRRVVAALALAAAPALTASLASAQAAAHTAVGDTSIFAPLIVEPSPNDIRLGSGAPGPEYWQNRADYDLQAVLDTAQKVVRGTMRLRYTNNSPVALGYVWFQTEQNAFKSGSLNSYYYPQESRFGARGFEGGDVFDRFAVTMPGQATESALKPRVQGTVTRVELPQPLQPGQTATFDVAWHFLVPEHGADRMGRDGALYEIAQWYPRVAVYDDVKGWNTEPYLGQGEFYLEYGDFNLAVTVPAGYIVAATGTLQNPEEVLTSTEVARLKQAQSSSTPVRIVTARELENGSARPKKTGTLTWRFKAQNVRDAVFAASPDYQWDAEGWNGRLAQAYYRPSAVDTWKDAADMARESIQEYSERWYPYPWPQISAVEGPISGMEYPMLAMETKSRDKYDLYNVVTHEIGHDWFPMLVGSNERTHFWQDEGFNTFINTFSEARRYPEQGTQAERMTHDRDQIEQAMARNYPMLIEEPADRIDPRLLGITEYVKTSVGLGLLRDEILGPEIFDDAFRTYIRRWAFKHPTPADFFRTMEDASGKQLQWFWRGWFLEDAHFDQAVDTVATRMSGDTQKVAVAYGNRDRGVLPIRAVFTFSDGTTQEFDYPADVWAMNTGSYVRYYDFPGKRLVKIELDPQHRLVDVDRSNNVWTAGK
ncbi:MAG TPA: M1 family metallopeptidase [Longimicrobiaceae bacterium]|nr:M1 family metallopeptidase [Longimicrobiaceae bacterium]